MHLTPQQWIPLLFIIPVIGLIVWRNLKPRPLRVEAMWIRPAMLTAIALLSLYHTPPRGPLMIGVCALALVAGAALGWMRGKMMRISVDPQTHMASVQGSPLAVLFILAVIAVRYGVTMALGVGAPGMPGPGSQITDALLLLAIGLVGVQGLEMWLRARKLIADSRAAAAGGALVS